MASSTLKNTCVILLAIITAGCRAAPNEIKQVTMRDAAVVALERACPVSGAPPEPAAGFVPIALALAPVVAQVVVDGGIKLLEQQKADRNFTTVAQGFGTLVERQEQTGKLELANKCLIVFRGKLGQPWQDKPADSGKLTKVEMEKRGLATYPDFYYEAWLTSPASADPERQINVIFDTRLLHFADSGAKSDGSGKKSIGTMLVFSRSAIVDKTDKGFAHANAIVPLLFKDIAIGSEISSDWRTELFQDQKTGFSLTDIAAGGPINLYAVLNETEEPRAFEEIILKAVSDKRGDLTQSLTKVITDAINATKEESKK